MYLSELSHWSGPQELKLSPTMSDYPQTVKRRISFCEGIYSYCKGKCHFSNFSTFRSSRYTTNCGGSTRWCLSEGLISGCVCQMVLSVDVLGGEQQQLYSKTLYWKSLCRNAAVHMFITHSIHNTGPLLHTSDIRVYLELRKHAPVWCS